MVQNRIITKEKANQLILEIRKSENKEKSLPNK